MDQLVPEGGKGFALYVSSEWLSSKQYVALDV